MNSSPTPNTPTPSRPSEAARRIPRGGKGWHRTALAWAAGACLGGLGLLPLQAQAHGEMDDPLPTDPGVRLDAALALSALDARAELPSQRLRGFLLQGDAGTDRQGLTLEHGTVGAAWRATDHMGGQLVLGKHGSDRAHVEEASVQWRWDQAQPDGDTVWLLTAGRQRPALGAAMSHAGHMDRWGLMPLAKQLTLNGDWIDDGLQLGWRGAGDANSPAGQWRADLGLWRGRVFPGGQDGPLAPSLHLGWQGGAWALDGWVARVSPDHRGSRVNSQSGHTHASPTCTASLKDVVCFGGHSTVAGASAVWDARRSALQWPLTLTASGWLRQESGRLESTNGLAQYSARLRGTWLQALWTVAPGWDTGLRTERAWTSQRLQGAGASLVATDAGLLAQRAATRNAWVLNWQPQPQHTLALELGQERGALAGTPSVRYAALRWIWRLDGWFVAGR